MVERAKEKTSRLADAVQKRAWILSSGAASMLRAGEERRVALTRDGVIKNFAGKKVPYSAGDGGAS